jgi:hypothetical protein
MARRYAEGDLVWARATGEQHGGHMYVAEWRHPITYMHLELPLVHRHCQRYPHVQWYQ